VSIQRPKAVYAASASDGDALQKVEKFKYLVVVFTNDGRRIKEIDTRIGKAHTALSLCGDKARAFKQRKTVSFQIALCSHSHLRF